MDFGISGLLDRIERDFGPRWAKALVGLLGLTAVVVCVGIIAAALSSAYAWIAGTLTDGGLLDILWSLTKVVAGILAIVLIAGSISSSIEMKRRLDKVRQLDGKIEDKLTRLEAVEERQNRYSTELETLTKKLLSQVETFTEMKEWKIMAANFFKEKSGQQSEPDDDAT